MTYAILIIVAIAGVALGMYIARRKANAGFIAKQMEQKAENKQKILALEPQLGYALESRYDTSTAHA